MDVTGPVQPNDIVLRASEIGQTIPGIGALAYRQARKGAQQGVKGMHMIPDTTDQGMDFMKLAKQNIDNQYMDMANMLNAAAPSGERLAYINEQEAGILKLLGGSGTKENNPAGIPSFVDAGYGGGLGSGYGGSDRPRDPSNPGGSSNVDSGGYGGGGGTDPGSSVDSDPGSDPDPGGGLTEKEIKDRLRNPNRFSPQDVQDAVDQANDLGMNTGDAFGNTFGSGDNETSRSLAIRDMMMNAAGYDASSLGYDNPFNTGIGLELVYDTYDRLIDKGYSAQDIKNMQFDRYKGLLGDMKLDATLDDEDVGSFSIVPNDGILSNYGGAILSALTGLPLGIGLSSGFTFGNNNMGGQGGNRRTTVEEGEEEKEEGEEGTEEEKEYLDASEYYLPEDYYLYNDRVRKGDLVPGRKRFFLKRDGSKLGEDESYSVDDIVGFAQRGGFNLLEPFSEYQARRREYYGDPNFGIEDEDIDRSFTGDREV